MVTYIPQGKGITVCPVYLSLKNNFTFYSEVIISERFHSLYDNIIDYLHGKIKLERGDVYAN